MKTVLVWFARTGPTKTLMVFVFIRLPFWEAGILKGGANLFLNSIAAGSAASNRFQAQRRRSIIDRRFLATTAVA
jgi:hypothetical protein